MISLIPLTTVPETYTAFSANPYMSLSNTEFVVSNPITITYQKKTYNIRNKESHLGDQNLQNDTNTTFKVIIMSKVP